MIMRAKPIKNERCFNQARKHSILPLYPSVLISEINIDYSAHGVKEEEWEEGCYYLLCSLILNYWSTNCSRSIVEESNVFMEEYIEKTEVKLFLLNHKISEIIFISASPFFHMPEMNIRKFSANEMKYSDSDPDQHLQGVLSKLSFQS